MEETAELKEEGTGMVEEGAGMDYRRNWWLGGSRKGRTNSSLVRRGIQLCRKEH